MGREHNPADVYPALLKAFNAGDIDATVACYEPQACFVLKSGHAARGAAELREMFRATFSYKPDLELDVRKIIVVEWKSKTVSSSGEAKVWAGTATDIVRRQPDGTWKLALDVPYGIEKAADCR
jgi:ketosteroid isomerase-like protein